MNCPNCNSTILNKNINIQTDVAQCHSCKYLFKVSENLTPEDDGFDINSIPKGTWMRQERDVLVLGASLRSPIAIFLVPFMLVWSGGSLGGIYGTQIASGEFNLFMSLFGIPFILGSIIFWTIALMSIWGKVEVRIDNKGGTIFTGLGKLGYKKKYTWDEVNIIQEKARNFNTSSSRTTSIIMEGKRRISFGLGLKESRRYYLLKALQSIHAKVKSKMSFIR